jgi:hypothetical protein
MRLAFRLMILLIGLSPLLMADDRLVIRGLLGAYVAVTVILVAWSIRPGEAAYLAKIIRPVLIPASVSAAWILIQALPLPISAIQHPIWTSAQAALNAPLIGSISVDPGATLVSFTRYLSACGVFFIAAAVTIDRQRAETVLFWLAAITTLMATLLIVHNLGGFTFLGETSSVGPRASISAAAILGTVLTAATVICSIERFETRGSRVDVSRTIYVITIISALFGFAVCWIAILFFMSSPATFAAACGVGTLLLIFGYRRLGLQSWLGFIFATVAVALPLSLLARTAMTDRFDWPLRFAADAPRSLIKILQRMISDTPWLGSGAGTFADLLPIYQSGGEAVIAPIAPTTAAGLVIELGYPALYLIVVVATAAAAWFVRGALIRGRDSFFPAAGASCVVALLIEAFFDASLATSPIIIIAVAALGLGLSQRESRTSR